MLFRTSDADPTGARAGEGIFEDCKNGQASTALCYYFIFRNTISDFPMSRSPISRAVTQPFFCHIVRPASEGILSTVSGRSLAAS